MPRCQDAKAQTNASRSSFWDGRLGQVAVECFTEKTMKTQKLRSNDIVEILTPLIDSAMMKSCSISSLKNDPDSFTKQIKLIGKPMALTHNGTIIALLCDPSVYKQIEERRQHLVALLEDAPSEFIPTVGRRSMLPSERQNIRELKQCIARIEWLEDSINSKKCKLYDLQEELQETVEKKLKQIHAIKIVTLASRIKPTNL
jgi:hypothetical protein